MEYKRLTKRLDTTGASYTHSKTYEIIERLAELEDKIERETLIELPCKVGALVWVIKEYPSGKRKIEGAEIVGFIWPTIDSKPWPADRFGDAYSEVFHKREYAEKRLKELKNED